MTRDALRPAIPDGSGALSDGCGTHTRQLRAMGRMFAFVTITAALSVLAVGSLAAPAAADAATTTTSIAPTAADFSRARQLRDAGFLDDARKEVTKQVTEHGGQVPADLRAAHLATRDSAWDKVLNVATTTLRWTLALVVVLLLLNIAIMFIFGRRRVAAWGTANSRYGRWRGALAWLWQPRLQVVCGSDGDGLSFAAALRDSMRTVAEDNGGGQVRIATSPDQPLALPDLGDLDPRLKPVMAIANLLYRRDIVTLSVSPQLNGLRGAGRTAELVAVGASPQSDTLWDRRMPDKEAAAGPAVASLVARIAGWATFQFQHLRPNTQFDSHACGTSDWRSFAAYLDGVDAHLSGDYDHARAAYAEALDFDPANRKALLNLAEVELYSADRESRRWAMAKLRDIYGRAGI